MRIKIGILGALVIPFLSAGPMLGQASMRWENNLEQACQQAAATNRLVLIHFTAPWCTACHEMDQEVFSHPSVEQAILANYVPVRLNVTHHEVIAQRFGVRYLPTDIVIAPDGRLLNRHPGRMERHQYLARLQQVVAEARRQPLAAASTPPTIPQAAAPQNRPAYPHETAYAPPAMAVPSQPFNPNVPYQPSGVQGNSPTDPVTGMGAVAPGVPASPNPALAGGNPAYVGGPALDPPTPYIGAGAHDLQAARPAPGWAGPAMQPSPSMPSGPGLQLGRPSPAANIAVPPTQAASQDDLRMGHPSAEPPRTSPPAAAYNPSPATTADQPMPPDRPNDSPFGLEGFCPVELVEREAWSVGDIRWGVNHRGCTYLFSGPEQQQRFLQDPDRYSPAAAGIDLVLRVDEGRLVPGRRQHGVFFPKGGRIFLFASEESLAKFSENPVRYVERLGEFEQAVRGTMRR